MVMELMEGGELLDRILQQNFFSEKETANSIHRFLAKKRFARERMGLIKAHVQPAHHSTLVVKVGTDINITES